MDVNCLLGCLKIDADLLCATFFTMACSDRLPSVTACIFGVMAHGINFLSMGNSGQINKNKTKSIDNLRT